MKQSKDFNTIQLEALKTEYEERLNKQDSFFRSITYSFPGLIIILDIEGTYLDVIASNKGLLYCEVNEVIGKKISEIFPVEMANKFMVLIQKAINTQTVQEVDYNLKVLEGKRWFEGKIMPFQYYNHPKPCVLLIAQDITERKEFEERLVENEAHLKSIINSTCEGICISANGKVVEVNKQLLTILDCKLEEIIGKPFFNFIAPDSVEEVKKHIRNDDTSPFEILVVAKNGKLKVLEARGDLIKYHSKNAHVVTLHDITNFKIAENALKESEERMRLFVNQMPVAVLIFNSKDEIDFINEQFLNVYGYNSKDLANNQLVSKLFYLKQQIEQTLTEEVPVNEFGDSILEPLAEEIQIICKDGSIAMAEVHMAKISDKLLFTFTDITLRKLVEQDLRTKTEELDNFFSLAIDLLCIADLEGNFRRLNKQWELTLGFTMEELEGTKFLDYVHPDDLENTIKQVRELGEHKSVTGFVNRYRCKDGSYRWIEWRSVPAGHLIYAAARDITERKNYEQKLKELNATKDKFFSIIAHDLRNPFNVLLGLSEVLMQKSQTNDLNDIAEFSTIIHDASKKTFDLLDNLLQWSRSQLNKIEFAPKTQNLSTIVVEVLHVLELQAEQKNIRILNTVNPDSNIFADANLLKTILRNLISNAIKFTNNYGTVTISEIKNESEVILIIEDNGVGMPQQIRDTLFNIDSKNMREGTKKESGTGLGLILCNEFVKRHCGKIWVESEPDKGSKFFVSFPYE